MPRDADKVLRNLNRQLIAMGMQPMKAKEIKQVLDQIEQNKTQPAIQPLAGAQPSMMPQGVL